MDYQMLGAFTAIPKEPHFSSPQIVKLGSTMAFHHNAQLLDPSSGSYHRNAQLLDPITGYRAVQYRTTLKRVIGWAGSAGNWSRRFARGK